MNIRTHILSVIGYTFDTIAKQIKSKDLNIVIDSPVYNPFPISPSSREILIFDKIKDIYSKWEVNNNICLDPDIAVRLDKLYNSLADKKSKETFEWFIQFKIACILTNNVEFAEKTYPYPADKKRFDLIKSTVKNLIKQGDAFSVKGYVIESEFGPVYESWISESYLLEGRCEPEENDVVIDAGAYKGESALWFAHKVRSCGKVYAFEVEQSHIEIVRKNIEANNMKTRVQLVDKGLWSENTLIPIVSDTVSTRIDGTDGTASIKVITLDSFVEDMKLTNVNFIKMDIEGAELPALKGAENTIKKFKPKLAICAYHKDNDILEISEMIKSLVPQYKLYLSHKEYFPYATTFFAAV